MPKIGDRVEWTETDGYGESRTYRGIIVVDMSVQYLVDCGRDGERFVFKKDLVHTRAEAK